MATTLFKNAGLATIGVLVQGVARFGYTIIIGRTLGAESLGQISGLIALSVFVSLFWPTGAGVAASRFVAPHTDSDSSHTSTPEPIPALVRDLLISAPILAVGTLVAALLIVPDILSALAAVALSLSFSAYAFTRGAAMGQGRFLRIAVADTVTSLSSLTLLLLVLLTGLSWATLLPLALGYAAFAWVCWPRGGHPARVSNPVIRRFVFYNSLAQLATGGALQITMLTARMFDTPTNVGLFAAAFSLATPASMLALSANQVLIPHFARLNVSDTVAARHLHRRVLLLATAGFTLVFGILILLSPFLIDLFYGPSFSGATPYMQVLLCGVFAYSISLVPAASLVASGGEREYTASSAIGFAITLVISLGLGTSLGAWAAAIGYVAGSTVSAILILSTRGRPLIRRSRTAMQY
ncbi:lipopolysaccharide biosynthesis protein [Leifsonia sp. YAF41]|uniref:lipopolysaccharide biosynthesis protein n=1 Tax=Leifsonia sp. YAF41 TaxID=3233086 RepID=UPI003F9704F2